MVRLASLVPASLTCPGCSAPVEQDHLFCRKCGSPLQVPVPETNVTNQGACPACSAPVTTGARFCRSCGGPLQSPAPAQSATTSKVTNNNTENRQGYNTCWFCRENPPAEKTSIRVNMYGIVADEKGGRRGSKQKITVLIPRCPGCKSKRVLYSFLHLAGVLLGGAVGFLVPFGLFLLTGNSDGSYRVIYKAASKILMFVGVVVGSAIAANPKRRWIAYAREYPVVKKKLGEGWKIGR